MKMEEQQGGAKPKISVILPGWNEEKNVDRCLLSLKEQAYDNFNVFLILGGDDPSYVEKARNSNRERLTVLDQVTPNKMKACNIAIRQPCLGDILLFSDVDCEFPKYLLARYAEAFVDIKKNIITGRVRPDPRSKSFIDEYHRCFEKLIAPREPKIVHSVMGANFAVRKTFFMDKFHRFDESVVLGTDHAIAQRFREIGEPIYFDPRLVVNTQMFSAGVSKYIDQQTRWVRIRVLRSKGSNQKAYRKGIKSLASAWAIMVILPLWLVATRNIGPRFLEPAWWAILILWVGFLTRAWQTRLKILRCRKNKNSADTFLDMAGAFGLVFIHFGIRIIASIQLIFAKYRT